MNANREYEKVVNKIIGDIKNGDLVLGDKIPTERALSTELEISRNSTREAIRLLENLGVLECHQGSGNYVTANMVKSLAVMIDLMLEMKQFSKSELFNFRMSIDKLICAMILERGADVERIADIADRILDEPVNTREAEILQDRRFHVLLVEATENRLLNLMVKAVSNLFGNMIISIRDAANQELKDKLFKAHKKIVEALRSGNRDDCDRAVERHYKIVDEIAKTAKLEEYLAKRVYNQIDVMDEKQEKDVLTGLYTKKAFFDHVDKYIEEHPDERLMLWSCDIQGLRYINEKYGMDMGDKLLVTVANHGAGYDGYLFGGRIGGDKFCILMTDMEFDMKEFNRVLIREYAKMFPISKIAIKNGIYHIRENDALSAHAMYVRSVLALQSVKNSYSTMVAEYSDSMRKQLLDSIQIEADAKNSLEKGEFYVYLQPKIDIANDTVAGAEALVRWIHSELGFMNPGTFIPIFEKNGFIVDLDMWVWEEVCKTIKSWKDSGRPVIPISVNVSRNSFEDAELAEKIIALVDFYELEHSLFEIEITEYACLENLEQIQQTIKQLHDAGFVISLDDFGTGYSSMIVLSKIDIDIMKLDMSLIRNDDTEAKRSALEFALQLAEMMQLKTVAEGIETKQQVERIRALGGDYIQGYYYSKPLPLEDFEKYIETYTVGK